MITRSGLSFGKQDAAGISRRHVLRTLGAAAAVGVTTLALTGTASARPGGAVDPGKPGKPDPGPKDPGKPNPGPKDPGPKAPRGHGLGNGNSGGDAAHERRLREVAEGKITENGLALLYRWLGWIQ